MLTNGKVKAVYLRLQVIIITVCLLWVLKYRYLTQRHEFIKLYYLKVHAKSSHFEISIVSSKRSFHEEKTEKKNMNGLESGAGN